MPTPFIGEVRMFGFDYAPVGWLRCDGSTYPINRYQPLYAIIQQRYGGDGETTFAVPDLRGRALLCVGQGGSAATSTRVEGHPYATDPDDATPDLTTSYYQWGESSGYETITLTEENTPAHSHSLTMQRVATPNPVPPTPPVPDIGVHQQPLAQDWLCWPMTFNTQERKFYVAQAYVRNDPGPAAPQMNAGTVTMQGGAPGGGVTAHNNMQPYLVMNYCIAYQGEYPSHT